MNAKTFSLIAGLTASLMGFSAGIAHAQTPRFGVEASAETGGRSDIYCRVTSGLLAGEIFANAACDPAGGISTGVYGQIYMDAAATTPQATPGRIRGAADAKGWSEHAPSGSATGYAYGRYYDTLTIESDTLPAGTPVAITFRHEVGIEESYGGTYSVSVDHRLYVNGVSISRQWSHDPVYPPRDIYVPEITVNTKVGARVTLEGRLNVNVKAGVVGRDAAGYLLRSGNASVLAEAVVYVKSLTEGVSLRADSGYAYPLYPTPGM